MGSPLGVSTCRSSTAVVLFPEYCCMQLLLLKESTTRPRLQSSSIVAVHGVVRTVHGDWGRIH